MWIVSKDGLYLTPGKNWTSDRNCSAIFNEPGDIPVPLEPGMTMSRVMRVNPVETTSSRGCSPPVVCYDWLTESLKKRARVVLALPGGELVIGVINGIRAEDGSGKCWLVTLLTDHGEKEVFTRST